MENKALGFEYLKSLLLQDINADQKVSIDNQLIDSDKQELLQIMNLIKMMSQQTSSEFQQIQLENIKKANELNQSNVENTYGTMMSLKSSLQDVIGDAKKAYKYVLWMYIVAFYLGIALIVTSIIFAAYDKMILSVAFGTIGLVDIVTHFIFKPPLDLQNSRANLAQLMVILTNWFADVMNLNNYYAVAGQSITFDQVERISDLQNKNTEKMLALIERYCEPGEHKKKE